LVGGYRMPLLGAGANETRKKRKVEKKNGNKRMGIFFFDLPFL
jgi:hypothetical protein